MDINTHAQVYAHIHCALLVSARLFVFSASGALRARDACTNRMSDRSRKMWGQEREKGGKKRKCERTKKEGEKERKKERRNEERKGRKLKKTKERKRRKERKKEGRNERRKEGRKERGNEGKRRRNERRKE